MFVSSIVLSLRSIRSRIKFYDLCWTLFHSILFFLIIADLGTYRFYDEYEEVYEFGAYESGTALFIVLFPIPIILLAWLTFRKGLDEMNSDPSNSDGPKPSPRVVYTIGVLTFVWVMMWFISSYIWAFMMNSLIFF